MHRYVSVVSRCGPVIMHNAYSVCVHACVPASMHAAVMVGGAAPREWRGGTGTLAKLQPQQQARRALLPAMRRRCSRSKV